MKKIIVILSFVLFAIKAHAVENDTLKFTVVPSKGTSSIKLSIFKGGHLMNILTVKNDSLTSENKKGYKAIHVFNDPKSKEIVVLTSTSGKSTNTEIRLLKFNRKGKLKSNSFLYFGGWGLVEVRYLRKVNKGYEVILVEGGLEALYEWSYLTTAEEDKRYKKTKIDFKSTGLIIYDIPNSENQLLFGAFNGSLSGISNIALLKKGDYLSSITTSHFLENIPTENDYNIFLDNDLIWFVTSENFGGTGDESFLILIFAIVQDRFVLIRTIREPKLKSYDWYYNRGSIRFNDETKQIVIWSKSWQNNKKEKPTLSNVTSKLYISLDDEISSTPLKELNLPTSLSVIVPQSHYYNEE